MRTLKCLIFNKFNFKRSPKSPKAIQRPLKSPKGLQTPQRHPKTPWEALGEPWTPMDAHGRPWTPRDAQTHPETPRNAQVVQMPTTHRHPMSSKICLITLLRSWNVFTVMFFFIIPQYFHHQDQRSSPIFFQSCQIFSRFKELTLLFV